MVKSTIEYSIKRDDVYFSFSLGELDILFLVPQKVTKESPILKLAFLFLFLNFPYLVLLFFFLVEEPEKSLTPIGTVFLCSLRIPLMIPKETDKVS